MYYHFIQKEQAAVINLFCGTYKVSLVDNDTVKVEVPISNTEWIVSQFTPWNWILDALKEIVNGAPQK